MIDPPALKITLVMQEAKFIKQYKTIKFYLLIILYTLSRAKNKFERILEKSLK